MPRVLRALFVVYVAATVLHVAYVVHHEPFAFDAWNVAADTRAEPATPARWLAFWQREYTTSNPRLGQPLAYLAYKLDGVAEVGSPLADLAIVLAAFVLGVGRRPRWSRGRDLAALAIGVGALWFAAPDFGSLLFCRAYATNYVWTAAIQLWFLVAFRVYGGGRARVIAIVAWLAFGVVAGLCNEHTGPTVIALAGGLTFAAWRRSGRVPIAPIAGIVGAVVGFALLLLAPGQAQRYGGLGQHLSLVQQIVARGVVGNVEILAGLLAAIAPLLLLAIGVLVIGARANAPPADDDRRPRALRTLGVAVLAAVLIAITMFASPKLGARFYLLPACLVLAGALAMIDAHLARARSYVPFVIVAVIASAYAAARTVPLYTRLDAASDRRLAALAATPPGGIYTAPAWEQIAASWWFLGDDFRDQKKRALVADYFDLERVLFRGFGRWSPLGVDDVRLVTHYEFDGVVRVDPIAAGELAPYASDDVTAIHYNFLDAVAEIQRWNRGHLRAVDLEVEFTGERPALPRAHLYVAKWRDDRFEGYVADVARVGQSTTRQIVPRPALAARAWDLYLVAVGDPPRLLGPSAAAAYDYVPWRTGAYWVLACARDECWVVAAISHRV